MFHEDVTIKRGDTISGIGAAYGHKASDWRTVWEDRRNEELVKKRGVPEKIEPGDVVQVPIPWVVVSKVLNVEASGVGFTVKRDGEKGKHLGWVQTVFRDNQPIGPNPSPFCVDACTPDDNLPFYWTNAELTADATRRKTFIDHPSRNAPTAAMGTTRWRAVVSISVTTKQRVTVYDSLVWGFDMTPANAITKIGPRPASAAEVTGHIHLLRTGKGTGPGTFAGQGWTFRTPPPE